MLQLAVLKKFSQSILYFAAILLVMQSCFAQNAIPFPHVQLTGNNDLSATMVEGINQFLLQETNTRAAQRDGLWKRDFSTANAFISSVAAQRAFLASRLGIADKRAHPSMQVMTNARLQPCTANGNEYTVQAVQWQVLDHLSAEGLLITPRQKTIARVLIIPDADITPEGIIGMKSNHFTGAATVHALAASGVEILIPTLLNRDHSYSGNTDLNINTQQPHREWIYRQAYTLGRHVIGYELQKIFAGVDWLQQRNQQDGNTAIGIAGYGEGGLLALYATALDTRITATLVSGYFNQREALWQEPIYRNVFGLLNTFGDAELATLSWPRSLTIEHSNIPEVIHQNKGATPGRITSPELPAAQKEYQRALHILPAQHKLHFTTAGQVFSQQALALFTKDMGITARHTSKYAPIPQPSDWVDATTRQERQVKEMTRCVQQELQVCERTRNRDFWQQMKNTNGQLANIQEQQRERFWNVLGKLPTPSVPFGTRARIYQQNENWTSYEVTLEVFAPGVFAWGILTVPKNIQAGEKRPVIVCQHGLEGLPFDAVTTDSTAGNYHYYKGFATRLAEKGYITFAPHNPYRGEDKFRTIQRKANPLGLTLFSVIISQHQRIVEWLQQLSFVDARKIAFYGLSYGGKTAMRVPAVVTGYALSICSADFNEWVRKVSTTNHPFGYVYTGEYDMPEWDLGHTFNYAEMAALIAPRPFMVERGHFDGVGTDEWVNYEFAKVRRYYAMNGIDKLVAIEHFAGPHSINGKGTFDFLDQHLLLPANTNTQSKK